MSKQHDEFEPTDPMDDLADELMGLGATEEPEGLTPSEKLTWARQTAFLVAYAKVGTVRKAAPAANVSRSIVRVWEREDKWGFLDRKEQAEHSHRESLVDEAWKRIRTGTGNRGSDVLLIAMLNAHYGEKFRPNQQPTDTTAVDLMAEWRRKAQADKAKAEQVTDFDLQQWDQRLNRTQ